MRADRSDGKNKIASLLVLPALAVSILLSFLLGLWVFGVIPLWVVYLGVFFVGLGVIVIILSIVLP